MHDDIEYRVMPSRAVGEAEARFDVIAELLKTRTRLATQRIRLQALSERIQEHKATHSRQDLAAGLRHQNARYTQIGAALNISYTGARNLVQRAEKRAAIPAWLNGLDLRTAKVLLRAGFRSTEEVREAIKAGKAIDRVQAPRIRMIQDWLQTA